MFYRIFISISLFLMLCISSLSAQKVLKDLKLLLKQKNASELLNQVRKLEKDSVACTYPKLYDYGMQANINLNEALNEKAYLKQPYDTVQFFRTVYGIYDYALKCDSVEHRLLAKGKGRIMFQKSHGELLHHYYRNLSVGGRYFYSKKNYREAVNLLKMAVDIPNTALWGSDKSILKTYEYVQTAAVLVRAAYLRNEYRKAIDYTPIALQDTSKMRASILKTAAEAYAAIGDSAVYLQYVREGLKAFPNDAFFFTELSDYYTGHGDYESSLNLSDSLLQNVNPKNVYFLAAKGLALMNLGKNREAIEYSQQILLQDSTIIDANYYIGAAYCNLAAQVDFPTTITSHAYKEALKKRRNYYLMARPYLELYREQAPNRLHLWGPLLYRLYMSLNQGDKFEEIQRLLNHK